MGRRRSAHCSVATASPRQVEATILALRAGAPVRPAPRPGTVPPTRFLVLWALGFIAFHVTSAVIHLLLIVAVVMIVLHFMRGRRAL